MLGGKQEMTFAFQTRSKAGGQTIRYNGLWVYVLFLFFLLEKYCNNIPFVNIVTKL